MLGQMVEKHKSQLTEKTCACFFHNKRVEYHNKSMNLF